MSKITEYINMLVQGSKNPKAVVEGVVNATKLEYGLLPEDQQEEIIRRRLLCASCPMMSKNREGYKTSRKDEHCTLCSCPIMTKTASLESSCGAVTYNERHPEDAKPILWEKYIKNGNRTNN